MAGNSKRKRFRKQTQSKRFPWLLLALGGGLLILVAALLVVNRGGADSVGTPQIAVEQKKIDYGYVKFGETRQFTFTVTNAGNGTLRFAEDPYIEVVEGC